MTVPLQLFLLFYIYCGHVFYSATQKCALSLETFNKEGYMGVPRKLCNHQKSFKL